MRGQKETRPCTACGQPITRLVSQARGNHWYCNHVCQAAHSPAPITIPREANSLRGQKETRPCEACGVPVTRYLSQRRLAQFWTCSSTCKGKVNMARRMASGVYVQPVKPQRGETNPCEQCGAPVYRNKSQAAKGEGRYCSQECHNIALTKPPVIKACENCGTEMVLKPSQSVRRFCSRNCLTQSRVKRPLDRMHNGRQARRDRKGYVMLWEPTHPNKSYKGWQAEHRLVVESVIGRYLTSDEQVDHINDVKDDNRIENLQVLSASDHSVKTVQDLWRGIQAQRDELAEYRKRYGPLS